MIDQDLKLDQNMDFILSNMFHYDQDHDDELFRILRVPCVEHKIEEINRVHPLIPVPFAHPNSEHPHPHQVQLKSSPCSQIDFTQPNSKRKSYAYLSPGQKKPKKNIMHRDIERQRRQEMANLYASLRSHLPIEYLKGKRSISDHVNQATNYIKHIQKNIEELQEKRDAIMKCNNNIISAGSSSRSSTATAKGEDYSQCSSSVIMVRPSCVGGGVVEVVVNTPVKQGLPLSRVIDMLAGEGLGIVSCNSAKRNQRLLYTLQSEVSDGGSVDIPELQTRMIRKCSHRS